MEKLDWLNGWYIRNRPAGEIAALVLPMLREKGIDAGLDTKLEMIVKELGQRAKTLFDIVNSIGYFCAEDITFDEKGAAKFLTPETGEVLTDLSGRIASGEFTSEGLHAAFEKIMEERGIKMGAIAQPVRVALTGGTVSPGIFEVMEILGKEEVLKRLGRAVDYISGKR
jgi:glutamyl-tRNA synthetase